MFRGRVFKCYILQRKSVGSVVAEHIEGIISGAVRAKHQPGLNQIVGAVAGSVDDFISGLKQLPLSGNHHPDLLKAGSESMSFKRYPRRIRQLQPKRHRCLATPKIWNQEPNAESARAGPLDLERLRPIAAGVIRIYAMSFQGI